MNTAVPVAIDQAVGMATSVPWQMELESPELYGYYVRHLFGNSTSRRRHFHQAERATSDRRDCQRCNPSRACVRVRAVVDHPVRSDWRFAWCEQSAIHPAQDRSFPETVQTKQPERRSKFRGCSSRLTHLVHSCSRASTGETLYTSLRDHAGLHVSTLWNLPADQLRRPHV